MAVFVMVMDLLPRNLAVVIGISSINIAHWTATVVALEDVFLVLTVHIWFRCVKTVPWWRSMNPKISSSLWSVF
jgi:hypothetical protein